MNPQNGHSAGGLTSLIQVLLGMKKLAAPTRQADNLTFFDNTLNESQKSAVRFCLESPEVACIHGPPGTRCLRFHVCILTQSKELERPTPSSRSYAN